MRAPVLARSYSAMPVHEILDDTAEGNPPRAARTSLRDNVKVKELAFDAIADVSDWRKRGRQAARQALKSREFLLWLGGNHLSVLPMLEELGAGTLVIQFDAHLDVYAFHDTTKELSHGNFLKHFESPRPRLVNVGHRGPVSRCQGKSARRLKRYIRHGMWRVIWLV